MMSPAAPREESGPPLENLAALKRDLEHLGSALVACSGGVDSALLAVVAREVLGDRMTCVFLEGPLVPRADARAAEALAARHRIPLAVVPFDPLGKPEIARNGADRCYHCKKAIARLLQREATRRDLEAVVDGVNASDLQEFRPGLVACSEEGILHPLAAAGITKPMVRALARHLDLAIAEKPSSACLASRVPYGEPLEPGLLAMVEQGEEMLHGLGFHLARVRAHGRLARIEIPADELDRAVTAAARLVPALKATGFAYVTLDLEGYRTGAMDEVLEPE